MSKYSVIHKDGTETHYVWCDETKQMIAKSPKMQALVYSNGSQESDRAKMVLEACGQDVREFLLGADFSDKQFRDEFGNEAEYPQVAIGLDHRGTLKETLKYMSDKGFFV